MKFVQDHMRKAGDVCFAEVSTDSKGMKFKLNVMQYNLQLYVCVVTSLYVKHF